MSLANQPNSTDYLQVIERTLQMTEQQGAAIRMLLDGINQVRVDVNERVEEVQIMVQEVRDSVVLIDQECYTIQKSVHAKSIELTKDRFKESNEEFKTVVGQYRRMIWSKLKVRFEVARYPHIRRIDYLDAVHFVQSFRPEDYI
jgi:uncharacterized protein YoxC